MVPRKTDDKEEYRQGPQGNSVWPATLATLDRHRYPAQDRSSASGSARSSRFASTLVLSRFASLVCSM